jgi:4-methylaminobutanoate oxidase (formaldehyde-forming)
VGLHALDSLRLEKSYKHWGADITPDDTPFEAGLGYCVKMDKDDFIGREALKTQMATGIKRRLVTFTLADPEPLIYHDEPVYRDGKPVGENTHGAYSHLLGCAIGMCYLEDAAGIREDWIRSGSYEINVAGRRYPIKIHLKPPYDPQHARLRM